MSDRMLALIDGTWQEVIVREGPTVHGDLSVEICTQPGRLRAISQRCLWNPNWLSEVQWQVLEKLVESPIYGIRKKRTLERLHSYGFVAVTIRPWTWTITVLGRRVLEEHRKNQ